jgi:hypothetical protein
MTPGSQEAKEPVGHIGDVRRWSFSIWHVAELLSVAVCVALAALWLRTTKACDELTFVGGAGGYVRSADMTCARARDGGRHQQA